MNKNQPCRGWIYYIKNKINGKMYIGKTNNYERRKREHFNLNKERGKILKRAFIKYGIENFEIQPIVSFVAVNKNVLNNVLNQLEKYYIKIYNTKQLGYNATLGGDGMCGRKHKQETKIKIGLAHKGKRVSKASRIKMSLSNHSLLGEKSKRPVLLYNLDGSFYKEFASIKEAVESTSGYSQSSTAEAALRDPKSQAYNYLWRYKNSESFPIYIEQYVNPRSKPVIHFTKEGRIIAKYSCIVEAVKATGIPMNRIQLSCWRKRKYATSDYWEYEK